MPKDHVLRLCLMLLLFGCNEASAAETVSGSLREATAEKFAGFRFRTYTFSTASAGQVEIAMRSRSLDSYLILVKPDGTVLRNDDAPSNADRHSAGDARITVDRPPDGSWLLVATTSRRTVEGDFNLIYEGISDFEPVVLSGAERGKVAAAFAARRVRDPTERIDALVEQLTLDSFRAELTTRLQKEIKTKVGSIASARTELDKLENQERHLAKAEETIGDASARIDDPVTLATVRSLLTKELTTVRRRIGATSRRLIKSLGERNAYAAASVELGKLDSIASELRSAEEALLSGDKSASGGDLRAAVRRLRSQRRSLGRTLAEKLLDSYFVRSLRFGGFRALERRVTRSRPVGGAYRRYGGYWRHRVYRHYRGYRGYVSQSGRGTFSAHFSPSRVERDLTVDPTVWFPALLPWPPPPPSSQVVLAKAFFLKNGAAPRTLGVVDDRLQAALAGVGYTGSTYWGIQQSPNSFALVTPLEQTDANGTPLSGNLRWRVSIAEIKSFSLIEYLKALFTARAGYFRVLVFVVSAKPFAPDPEKSKERLEAVERWSRGGVNVLPREVRAEAFTGDHRVTVLVYEFVKRKNTDQARTAVPGRLRAPDHLVATKLSSLLGG